MKIFTIPGWYKTNKNKEECIFIYEQMLGLKKENDITVLSVQPSKELINKKIEYINDNGIKTYYTKAFSLWSSKLRYNYIAFYKKALLRMFKYAIKKEGMPDVIYAHFSYPAGYVATMIGKKYNIPVVVQEHYSKIMSGNIDYELKKIIKNTVKLSDKFFCVSNGLKDCIANEIIKKNNIIVVPNILNSCFRYKKPIKKDKFIFLSIGSLINRKGFDVLIKAFSEEFQHDKNIELHIAGSGPEYDNLNNLIKELNMSKRIKLLGQLSREDTLNNYAKCDCFALASRAETFGLVYREALCVGRPIISTKHGGFTKDDWHNDYGKIIDIDSLEQLKESMRYIYENYNKYNLKKISESCLKDYSEERVVEKIQSELIKTVSEYKKK